MNKQNGFSLLELMIAIGLGLFLMSGLLSVLSSGNSSYISIHNSSQLYEDSRLVMSYLHRKIKGAGFRGNIDEHKTQTPFAGKTVNGIVLAENQIVFGTSITGGNDSLTLRYKGFGTTADGSIKDCEGDPVNQNTEVILTYKVNSSNQLVCEDQNTLVQTVIIDNVERFKVLYGEDGAGYAVASDGTGSTATTDWNKIDKIRFALLLRSEQQIAGATNNQTYTMLSKTITTNKDRYMRTVFEDSVQLLNNPNH